MTAADSGRSVGLVLLAAGVVLIALAWRWRAGGGIAVVQAAVAGPLSAALGLGKLAHGSRIPPEGMSRLTRIYGALGGVIGGAYLFLVGRWSEAPVGRLRWVLPVVATAIWLVPVPSTSTPPPPAPPGRV